MIRPASPSRLGVLLLPVASKFSVARPVQGGQQSASTVAGPSRIVSASMSDYALPSGTFAVIAALYSSIGQAGGTGYVAVMGLAGADIGFVSGVTGVGGGIFLAPLVLTFGWIETSRRPRRVQFVELRSSPRWRMGNHAKPPVRSAGGVPNSCDVRGGESILEIGIGWGGLAERLLHTRDCNVRGVTLSASQLGLAQRRLAPYIDGGRCDLRLQDYRDIEGSFDRTVSIEVLEAVGEAYWPVYFEKLRSNLKPGGRAVLQVISIDEARFADYRRNPDFIQQRIFPGGMLPTRTLIAENAAAAGPASSYSATATRGLSRSGISVSNRAGRRSNRSGLTNASGACGATISIIVASALKRRRSTSDCIRFREASARTRSRATIPAPGSGSG